MKAKEIEKLIINDGWFFVRQNGSHRIYKHEAHKGIVVIPFHSSKELPKGTEQSIIKKAGIKK